MNCVERFEHEGLTIKIYPDEDTENPRSACDQFGTMVCFHRRYELGDKQTIFEPEDFEEDDWREAIERKVGPAVVLPLYLYDHSGLSISTARSYPYNCPWDSSVIGFIYATHAAICKEYSVESVTDATERQVVDLLRAEVEEYDQFLTGQVYGYNVETEDGANLESCWGFYGFAYCKEQAIEAADAVNQSAKKHLVVVECDDPAAGKVRLLVGMHNFAEAAEQHVTKLTSLLGYGVHALVVAEGAEL